MAQTGGESSSRSENSTSGWNTKTLKLTVIFAPCSRSELLDVYNPVEFPTVNKQMRVISRQLSASGSYKKERQDKIVFINCASLKCDLPEGGEPIPQSSSMLDKLERAIQLIHELLDSFHGYKGTVQTIFCSYQPLEDIMVALQSILGCPNAMTIKNTDFASDASFLFSDSFSRYKEWTFVNKHTSTYKAIYKYESSNDKSEEENLKEENERLINSIPDETVRKKFRDWYDADGMSRTTNRLGVEGYVKYHPEYSKYLDPIDKNNRRLREITKENEDFAAKWGEKSKGQRIAYVDKQLNKKYDTNAVKKKYQPHLDELKAKMRQLDYQQGNTQHYAWHTDDMDKAASDYRIGANRHKDEYSDGYHSIDTIEYNGEYYTRKELAEMYNGMKSRMDYTISQMNADKKAERSKAMDAIHKQVYTETFHAALSIMNIVAIAFAPLALVDILVISYELVCTDKKFDFSTLVSIALDIFALIPFVGAVFSLGGRAGNIARGAMSDIVSEGANATIKGADSVKGILPYVSLGGYLSDVNVFIKNVSNLEKGTRALAVANMTVQTMGHVGSLKGAIDGYNSVTSSAAYTAQDLGEDFYILVKN